MGCPFPTFSIVKPAIDNTRVDMSSYGQSIFADAIDAIQAVGLSFDALINEVDVSKMRIFLSDVLFDKESDGKGKRVSIPFGKSDCTVFRKAMSTEDMVQDFAPALRTDSQVAAFRIARRGRVDWVRRLHLRRSTRTNVKRLRIQDLPCAITLVSNIFLHKTAAHKA